MLIAFASRLDPDQLMMKMMRPYKTSVPKTVWHLIKELFENTDFEKKNQPTIKKMIKKLPSMHRVKVLLWPLMNTYNVAKVAR